ncbi:MAG: glycosyltransferase [Lachnospiraceae bacterium]|nr:glycosyltransferase [Candidatus Colinaster scatohippi]
MKVLLYDWSNYIAEAVDVICEERGFSVDKFRWKFEQDEYDEEFIAWFDTNIEEKKYDFVLSVNFHPMVAIASNKKGYKYVAWCYDCPLNITYPEETLSLPGVYCFLFDRNQYLGYKNNGIDNVYHLPLGFHGSKAVNMQENSAIKNRYECDIAMVGSLYESQLPLIVGALDDNTKNAISELIHNQEELYNYNLIKECITDELIQYMNSQNASKLEGTGRSFSVNAKAFEFALSCEVTRRNRLVLLSLFSKRYDTRLYSGESYELLADVQQCGRVDYRTEMPYVFKYSKINLNPSLRCIETGIPLRVFDIMGYGGFVLTNYQQEIEEMYVADEEVVMYDCYADAMEKATYYLKNEDIRQRIACRGQAKTLEKYTLQAAFDKILKKIE